MLPSPLRRTLLVLSVLLLFGIGLLMIFDATSADIMDHGKGNSTHIPLVRQVFYGACGLLLGFIATRVRLERLFQYSPRILFLLTILLILCFVPGIGKKVNGSNRWIHLGLFSLQPSEFVKIAVPLFMIGSLGLGEISLKRFAKVLFFVSIPLFLILIEPNNGTVGVIVLIVAALCFLLSVPFQYWALPLLLLFSIIGTSMVMLPYGRARLTSYLSPESDLLGKGHQPYQAKIAVGSGGLLGKGPGSSLQKMSYLPEAQNDYIAAIFAEEYGFLGIAFVVVLYMLIALFGFGTAILAGDREKAILAAILTFLICFQAFMNLGVVSGLLPSTGLNLPFFSQGGTSLIANFIIIGLLLRIYHETHLNHSRGNWRTHLPGDCSR